MIKKIFICFLFSFGFCNFSFGQSINLNESHIINNLRISQILGEFKSNISFTQRPFALSDSIKIFDIEKYSPTILKFFKGKGKIKMLPIDFNIEFNSHHPYSSNNGSMIPNKGYQQLVSGGFYIELGPLSVQLKPEYVFSENKFFEGFPDTHYDLIWSKRYALWNTIDIPERFGIKSHSKTLIGQSFIKLNFKGISLGFSNENIWWGPSIRNSIMMSNNARGFKHFTFNSTKPLETKIGNFEWQFITGRLENSGFTPPNTEKTYAGTLLYSPKINQLGDMEDWRFLQGIVFSYSPKWVDGLTLGYIKWIQMYSGAFEGKYTWIDGKSSYFPLFRNLFRKNDIYPDFEEQTDQAAGLFFRWIWKDSKAELYAEFYYNDAKENLRDLLLDSDHSRAATVGIRKIFKTSNKSSNYLFSWEWTQLEQTASRKLRGAGSWYRHSMVVDGFTNRGEVLGASIGPGSNSHYFSIEKFNFKNKIGLSFEIIDQDNDFYYYAFESAKDYRRYWKDFNLLINIDKKLKNIWISSKFIYSRSLNYQWDLDDTATSYYHPGRDVNNFHVNVKMTYEIPIN